MPCVCRCVCVQQWTAWYSAPLWQQSVDYLTSQRGVRNREGIKAETAPMTSVKILFKKKSVLFCSLFWWEYASTPYLCKSEGLIWESVVQQGAWLRKETFIMPYTWVASTLSLFTWFLCCGALIRMKSDQKAYRSTGKTLFFHLAMTTAIIVKDFQKRTLRGVLNIPTSTRSGL